MEKIGKMFNRGQAFDVRRISGFDPFAFAGGAGGKTTIAYSIVRMGAREPAVFQWTPIPGSRIKGPAGGIWGKLGFFHWKPQMKQTWYQTGWLDWWLKSQGPGVPRPYTYPQGGIPAKFGAGLTGYIEWVRSLPKIGMLMPGGEMEYGFKDWGPVK